MTENGLFGTKRTSTLVLIVFSVLHSLALASLEYHFIDLSRSYQEAKSYCRQMYTDLATVPNSEHMKNMIDLVSRKTARAWIGLESRGVRTWHWSMIDQQTDFFRWRSGEPGGNNRDACAAMDSDGKWFESDCRTKRHFVCLNNSDTSVPIFVAEAKSWRNAQSHCRGLSSDLVSVHSAEENAAVRNASASPDLWIGLFKDPWIWSDGSNSSFRFWKSSQPNYLKGQNCTAAVFRDGGRWNDLGCSVKRDFVCHGARKPALTSASSRSTAATFTTNYTTTITPVPVTSTGEPTTTTEAFTITATTASPADTTAANVTDDVNETTKTPNVTDFVNATTKTPNITDVVNETTKTPNVTEYVNATTKTPNVTDFVNATTKTPNVTDVNATTKTPNVTDVNNITTKTANVTATQPIFMTSVSMVTVSASVTRTEYTDKGRNTTQPTDHSWHSGKVILIQKNLTWIKAMSYCREHHVDLVHVATEGLQDEVAKKAKDATTAHVWLGLRYTCKFNFWFWVGSTAGCYQNWAPGHGPEREYDCGASGAVEATGGQRWVGLPQTEKLNFMCSLCVG